MNQYQKYYKKTREEKIEILQGDNRYDEDFDIQLDFHVAEAMSENTISLLELPLGVALNFFVDQEDYVVPMAIEEPSVIAAASKAAGMFKANGGFKTLSVQREMMGQILFSGIENEEKLHRYLSDNEANFKEAAYVAFPSILKRGGGINSFRYRVFKEGYVSFDVFFDTQEAMGANMINTMLEAIKDVILDGGYNPVMAILSNLAEGCLTVVEGRLKLNQLDGGEKTAQRIVDAYQLAVLDPYRCATNNKGVMNGVDAFCVATGNDWRSIESCLYTYAAQENGIIPFVRWSIEEDELVGKFKGPLPLASVGGSMKAHPKYQLSAKIMRNPKAQQMMSLLASLAIAQNFAAIYALVTSGIQQGHMRLHMRTMAIAAGATSEEVPLLMQEIKKLKPLNQERVNEVLENIRNEK